MIKELAKKVSDGFKNIDNEALMKGLAITATCIASVRTAGYFIRSIKM